MKTAQEALDEELNNNTSLAGMIDPTLTMDLTTMNPPNMEMSLSISNETMVSEMLGTSNTQGESSQENVEPSEGSEVIMTGKEAESLPLKMDTEPERAPLNETKSTAWDDDDDDAAFTTAALANVSESETTNETQTELPSGGDEDEDSSVDTPTKNVTPSPTSSLGDNTGGLTTLAPIGQAITTSSPTSNEAAITTLSPTESLTTPLPTQRPTVEYVEPDDSLDPLANNKESTEKEAFQNGESISQHDNEYDDSKEEPIPSTVGGGGEWDGNDDGLSSTEDSYVDEEEVKKVGGGVALASIILMIYTAYQMSENPDGICAR